jgi:CHAD domain-containing protein
MNKEEIGVFLYRYYQKRTSSFLSNIYKAGISADSKDIHRARLDVKKIFALYGLFEMLDPEAFKNKGGFKLFRPLYRQAGKVREIQVHYLLLADENTTVEAHAGFVHWLKKEERRAIHKFLQLKKEFRESDLKATDKVIYKICHSSSIFKLRSKTREYLKRKAEKILEVRPSEASDKEIHGIRRHLKAMSAITTLVYSIKPVNKLDLIISSLNKTEMMIGDWHDRVVLKEAIDRYLRENKPDSEVELNSLIFLKQTLNDYNQNLFQHFIPEVSTFVEGIVAEYDEKPLKKESRSRAI